MSTLEEHGVITAVKPTHGGWRYEQEYMGQLWRIPTEGSAPSGKKLVQMVRDFRATNGIDMGDPLGDVAEYIKKASPINDRFKGRVIGQPRVREITPIIHDVRQWVDSTAAAKPRFVYKDEVNARVLVCLKCPQNIRWESTGCGACNTEVEVRSYELRQGKQTVGEFALKACRLHRFHLPSAVHLDRDFLPARHADAPEPCWVPRPTGE